MTISLDITAAERSVAAGAILSRLAADPPIDLLLLSGAELCILGGPQQPVFWEPLATSWVRSDAQPRQRMIEACTAMMIKRGLLIEETPGEGYHPGARFAPSPELGLMLAARSNPTFVITATPTAKLPPVCLFGVGDAADPVRGIVIEVPDRVPGTKQHAEAMGPLGLLFYYFLHTPDSAAEYLAEWVLRPTATKRFHKQPPQVVTLLRPGHGVLPRRELTVVGAGGRARVEDRGAVADYDQRGLEEIMRELVNQGSA